MAIGMMIYLTRTVSFRRTISTSQKSHPKRMLERIVLRLKGREMVLDSRMGRETGEMEQREGGRISMYVTWIKEIRRREVDPELVGKEEPPPMMEEEVEGGGGIVLPIKVETIEEMTSIMMGVAEENMGEEVMVGVAGEEAEEVKVLVYLQLDILTS